MVVTRLGDTVRAAGTAEFAGYNTDCTPHRIAMLRVRAAHRYPALADVIAEADEWACLRPCTPAGPPIIGQAGLKNVYVNAGHGTLGWTQATGSAAILADVVDNTTPAIDMTGLSRYLD